MKRILFCVVPEKGHVNPCIGPAQHLRAAGFEVAFYAPADISAQLDHAGTFTFLGPRETPERHDLSRGASFAANIRDAAWLRRWIHTLLIEYTPAQVDGIRVVLREWQPDVVVIDPLLYASAIAAELEGLPWVAMSNSLNPVLPDDLDSDLLRTVRWLAPERDRLFARYGLEARFRGCDILSPHLTLAFTTEDLVGTAPQGVELVGPALPTGPRGDETPFPWERLDSARPLVYMSLGSQLYYQPELFAKVIEATRGTSAQLVLSVGELIDSDLLPTVDDRVIAVRYAPQLALLQRTQAFINHGGANSVMEALACGVPMLLSPFCNDQFHSAHFVEQAGAGRCLDLERATVRDIADAIGDLLRPGPLREHAAKIAASYQRDGSAQAASLISELASGNRRATTS
ncbi:glycosyltransferase [Paraburkholderia megapolitana]|uniref:Glycosyltransferase, MGT family n=1 Tax=Paraburkholderia megapolitana TaxID=420953 RepID=A0A1I3KS19_9BURK|nr:glycosyltransferase [Paraburkholderia megapolitana]QDQ80428.1 glycosyltransferase family 1 protein [Paraburkholderia megapolitana]SFI75138.1 glycosyltransferase, MGT family [Paraburkholderia megapolitana]